MQPDPKNDPPAGQGDPPAGNNGTGQGDPPATEKQNPPGDGSQEDLEKLKASLAASRKEADDKAREAREAKKRADAAEAELQKHRDLEKSDLERAVEAAKSAETRAAAAEQRARDAALRAAVIEAARAENFSHPEDPYIFLASELAKVEFDDRGEPIGIADLVKKLATDRKDLIASKQTATPPAPSDTPGRDGKGISPEELKTRREEMMAHTRNTL